MPLWRVDSKMRLDPLSRTGNSLFRIRNTAVGICPYAIFGDGGASANIAADYACPKQGGVMARLFRVIGAGVAAFLAIGLTSAAQAQDCPPLKKVAGVKLESLPNSRRVVVPVTINNVPKKFLLDTAGMSGFITKEAADELQLPGAPFSGLLRQVKTFGLGDKTFALPDANTNDTSLFSSPKPTSPERTASIDGILVNAFLLNKGDLDIDFPGGSLNLFSPDHCPGKVNYWGAPDIGYLPLSYDPLARTAGHMADSDVTVQIDLGHLTVPVTLDGHALNAWIDTSAEKSSISTEVAQRIFNLKKSDLGPVREEKIYPESVIGFLADNGKVAPGIEVHRRRFSQLSVGHIDIKNLELFIYPDDLGRNNDTARTLLYARRFFLRSNWTGNVAASPRRNRFGFKDIYFSNAKKDVPDMTLGMDVLRHLHIYIAMNEKRMYFSTGSALP